MKIVLIDYAAPYYRHKGNTVERLWRDEVLIQMKLLVHCDITIEK